MIVGTYEAYVGFTENRSAAPRATRDRPRTVASARADAQLATIWLRIGLIPRWLVGITLRDHAGLPDVVLAVRVLALLDGAYLAPRWVIDVDRDD